MKKVVLRESRAPYTLAVDDETLGHEPVILEREGRPVAALVPIAEYEAFRAWREALQEPWPEEPPPTPEGDQEALAAVDRIRNMFADVDPEIWRDVIDDNLLAVMRRHGLTDLASNDEDFKRVTGIRLWTPD